MRVKRFAIISLFSFEVPKLLKSAYCQKSNQENYTDGVFFLIFEGCNFETT